MRELVQGTGAAAAAAARLPPHLLQLLLQSAFAEYQAWQDGRQSSQSRKVFFDELHRATRRSCRGTAVLCHLRNSGGCLEK